MISTGLGGSYSKRILPGFWIYNSPLTRLPSGPTWTKLPTNCCTLERYVLTLSIWVRWVGFKATVVVAAGAAGASGCLSRWNSDFSPAARPLTPDWALVAGLAAGAAAPSLGSGAGVGRGMVSAAATDVSAAAPSNMPTNNPWLPAITPLPSRPCPGVGSRPVWRHDD